MVKFKGLKYKHVLESNRLIQEGTEQEQSDFIFSLVADWDYKDIETGEPIPVGDGLELSVEQYNEVLQAFQQSVEGNIVPNANAAL